MSRILSLDELRKAQRIIHNEEVKKKQPIFNALETSQLRNAVMGRYELFSITRNGKTTIFKLTYYTNRLGEQAVKFRPVDGLIPVGGIELNLLKDAEVV